MPSLVIRAGSAAGIFQSSDDSALFVADFSTPTLAAPLPYQNPLSFANCYNFATRSASNIGEMGDGQTNWTMTHMPAGGPGGIPCVQFRQLATRWQYPMTFTTPTLAHSFALGDAIYYRSLIYIEAGSRFNASTSGGKFIDHGSGFNRNIAWISPPYAIGGGGGTLGWPGAGGGATRAVPSWFSLAGSNWSSAPNNNHYYGSSQISRGTGFKSSEPPLITCSDNPSPPAPGPASAVPVGGWYYIQHMARSGNVPSGAAPFSRYSVWVNNNTLATPTADQFSWNDAAEPEVIDPSGWNAGVVVGSYVGGGSGSFSGQDFVWRLAKFEVGPSFRTDWYPG